MPCISSTRTLPSAHRTLHPAHCTPHATMQCDAAARRRAGGVVGAHELLLGALQRPCAVPRAAGHGAVQRQASGPGEPSRGGVQPFYCVCVSVCACDRACVRARVGASAGGGCWWVPSHPLGRCRGRDSMARHAIMLSRGGVCSYAAPREHHTRPSTSYTSVPSFASPRSPSLNPPSPPHPGPARHRVCVRVHVASLRSLASCTPRCWPSSRLATPSPRWSSPSSRSSLTS